VEGNTKTTQLWGGRLLQQGRGKKVKGLYQNRKISAGGKEQREKKKKNVEEEKKKEG